MDKLRFGLVGLNFGRHILNQIQSGKGGAHFALAGVCDLDAAKAAEFAAQTKTRVYRDLTELLADPTVPAVGLFTPPIGRAALIRQAIRAGKHVLTTKPFELDAAAAAAVLAEARQLGRAVHLNSPAPTLPPDLALIQQWQQQHQLGRAIGGRVDVWANYHEQADGRWYDDPARCPVAPILRLGIYLINDLVALMGAVDAVQVFHTRVRTGRPTPDNAQLALRFRNGGLGNIFASFCVSDGDSYRNALTFNCENGTIYRNVGPVRTADTRAELSLVQVVDGQRRVTAHACLAEGSGEYQWDVLARAVRGEAIAGETTAETIVAGVKVLNAMARAEQSGATERVA